MCRFVRWAGCTLPGLVLRRGSRRGCDQPNVMPSAPAFLSVASLAACRLRCCFVLFYFLSACNKRLVEGGTRHHCRLAGDNDGEMHAAWRCQRAAVAAASAGGSSDALMRARLLGTLAAARWGGPWSDVGAAGPAPAATCTYAVVLITTVMAGMALSRGSTGMHADCLHGLTSGNESCCSRV